MSIRLAILLSRFYTRSLFFDMELSALLVEREERGQSGTAASRAELARRRGFQTDTVHMQRVYRVHRWPGVPFVRRVPRSLR